MDPSRGGRPKRDRGRTWKSNDNAETEEILGRQKAAKQAGKQAAKKGGLRSRRMWNRRLTLFPF